MASCPLVAVIESIVGAAAGWATSTDVSEGAEKVKLEREFVAKSRIVPELRSRDVATAMPSVSNSTGSVATVYLNNAVLESVNDWKIAYSVADPTVKTRRGAPVIVTDSEKPTVKVGVSEGLYVPFAGAETEEIVGAV
jgi:hypothetical protein